MKKVFVSTICSYILLGAIINSASAKDFLYASNGDTTVSHVRDNENSLTAATTLDGNFVIAKDKNATAALFNLKGDAVVAHITNSTGDSATGAVDQDGNQMVQIKTNGDDTPLTLFSPGQ